MVLSMAKGFINTLLEIFTKVNTSTTLSMEWANWDSQMGTNTLELGKETIWTGWASTLLIKELHWTDSLKMVSSRRLKWLRLNNYKLKWLKPLTARPASPQLAHRRRLPETESNTSRWLFHLRPPKARLVASTVENYSIPECYDFWMLYLINESSIACLDLSVPQIF